MTVTVKFKRLADHGADLPLPTYATAGAAAFDLRAAVQPGVRVVLEPGQRVLVPTGFALALPEGFEMQIRPRSGLALKHGVTVMNAPATIDADFRGHLQICLVNLGAETFAFGRGDRIAQAVVAPVSKAVVIEVDELDASVRGEAGFGSTGIA